MATPSTPQPAQPPPVVPSDPSISTVLGNYLNQLTLWCRTGFADKIKNNTATPGLLLQAKDAMPGDPPGAPPRVYMLQVSVASGAPTLVWTPAPPGTGKP
jgi:hypothetical protein